MTAQVLVAPAMVSLTYDSYNYDSSYVVLLGTRFI